MSIIGKKLHSLLNKPKQRKETSKTVSFEDASTIGVLFTWEDQRTYEEIQHFIRELETHKDVKVLCFNNLKSTLQIEHPTVNISELSSLGKLNSEAAHEFINAPLDFLVHMDFELNEITQSILAKSKAKCRMGIYSDAGQPYYEMMIGINKSAGVTNFAHQILKYAKGIK